MYSEYKKEGAMMTLETLLSQLGDERAMEFRMLFQFASDKEKEAVLNSNLDALSLHSLLLATQGSCSTEGINDNQLIEMITYAQENNLSLGQVNELIKRVTVDNEPFE